MAEKIKYIKYMPFQTIISASRNKREIDAALSRGFDVSVFSADPPERNAAAGLPKSVALIYDGEKTLSYHIPRFKRVPIVIKNHLSVFKMTKGLHADVLSCHNLEALRMAWLANLFSTRKPILIYDSHEFELGLEKNQTKPKYQLVKMIEGFLIKRCAFSIMVNDSIADEVQRIHKLKERPLVIRSTPSKWTVDSAVCMKIRQGITEESGIPEMFTLMYHGGVIRGRGVEALIRVLSVTQNIRGIVLGNGDAAYLEELKQLGEKLGVSERLIFHKAVPAEELWKYVGAADVGMILAPANCKNHLYSLPNKFFENIQSETPVICPAYPAMQEIMEKYKFGLCADPTDIDELNFCIEKLRTDKEFYLQCKQNIKKAKEDLCWEKEKERLMDAFQTYLLCNK